MSNFGKLSDGVLQNAPYPLCEDGRKIFTSDKDVYLSHGWKEIVPSPCPDDGKEYTLAFEETDTQIRYIWREVENINTIE